MGTGWQIPRLCQNPSIPRERLSRAGRGGSGQIRLMLEVARNLPVVGAAWHRKPVMYDVYSDG